VFSRLSSLRSYHIIVIIFPEKLINLESIGECRVTISNRFATLGNLDTEVDINRAWETIRENIKRESRLL
jgi:hypothetical protein